MPLIRPRLTDYYGLTLSQAQLDFAIPFFDEDIPLYIDPFLLWRSPSQQDNALHTNLTKAFNYLGYLFENGNEQQAIEMLIAASECDEVGLGLSVTRKGNVSARVKHARSSHYSSVFLTTQKMASDTSRKSSFSLTVSRRIALAI
jgi:hypothetical protein